MQSSRVASVPKAKKNALPFQPPQAAVLRLRSAARSDPILDNADNVDDKKHAAGGSSPPPAMASTDAPSEIPTAKSKDKTSPIDQMHSSKREQEGKQDSDMHGEDGMVPSIQIVTYKTGETTAKFEDVYDSEEVDKTADKDANKPAQGRGEKSGETVARGRVKMKRTPKVPKDLPPDKKIERARKASTAAISVSTGGNLKSPPEELAPCKKSPRTKKPTEKTAAAGKLKSSPQAQMPAQKINSQSSIEEPTKNECTESPEEEFRRTTSPRTKARADKTVTAEKINVTSKDSGKKDAEFSKQDPEPAKYCTAVKACAISEELESDSEGSIDVSAYPLVEKGLHDYKYYADQLGFDEAYLVHNDESGFEFTNDAGDSVIVIGMDDEEETYIVQVLFDSYNKEQKGRLYEAPIADFKQKYPYRGGSKLARKSNIPKSSSKAKQSKRKTSAVAEESIANPEEGANVCRAKRERDSSGNEDDESSTTRHRHKSVKTNQFLETKKEITWTTRMAMLTAHKEKYNTCDLTHAPTGSIDPLLQNFVCESRKQYKRFQRGDHSTLTMEKIEKMRGLGFVFSPMESGSTRENRDRRLQKRWDARFKELERYKAEYGDCLVKTIGGDHPKLGNWVRGQRKLVNKLGREGISPDRLAKLDAIGFDYNPVTSGAHFSKRRANMMPRIEANWEKHYKQLVLYKKKHGDLIVGPNSVGYPGLFEWIHHQRKEYKKWELCNEKALMFDSWIAKLNGLGFDWAPMKSGAFREFVLKRKSEKNSGLWHRRYRELQKFHKKNGHCYVSYRDDDEVLARWINVQRKLKRKHDQGKETPLTEERMKLLKDINLDWNPSLSGGMTKITQAKHDKEWEDAFQKLCAFKKKRGHANPKKTVAKLGPWAYRMRKLYADKVSGKATTLSDTKVAKLESVGFNFVSGA